MWLRRTGGGTCAFGGVHFVEPVLPVCVRVFACHKLAVGPSKKMLSSHRGESRNELRGLKSGGYAMCGAVPCLSADLTAGAWGCGTMNAGKMLGKGLLKFQRTGTEGKGQDRRVAVASMVLGL